MTAPTPRAPDPARTPDGTAYGVPTAAGRAPGANGVRRPRRRPAVAGVAGGVGTTTVAAALGAADCGVFTGRAGRPVDVLVCRATGDSLVRAGRAAQRVVADGHARPVVAVTRPDPQGPSRPVNARMRLLEPHAAAVVVLPFVRRWRDVAEPLVDLRGLLDRPPTELPRPLRRYAAALHRLRAALDTTARPSTAARSAGRPTAAQSAYGRTPTCAP